MKTRDFIKLLRKLPQNTDIVFAIYTDSCGRNARETVYDAQCNNAYGGACVRLQLPTGQYIAKRKVT